jgi:hypothetical protein
MQVKVYPNFKTVIEKIQSAMRDVSIPVHTEKWQGMVIEDKPEMSTYEVLNVSFSVPTNSMNLNTWREDIKPNIPWADDHFAERVCGWPINPGIEWANWPYGKSADRFRESDKFNHNYMERYWPKHADFVKQATKTDDEYEETFSKCYGDSTRKGIRYDYGDLDSVVNLLAEQPLTRQAYLPIWFPEDTGVEHGGRVPCSLGYHFILRGKHLHMNYYLRSCDFVRHFRDDIYLTLRLLIWVIEQVRLQRPEWKDVEPGFLNMHVTSMHMFKNDYYVLFNAKHPKEIMLK